MSEPKQDIDPRVERLTRRIRHIGYVVFGVMFVCLVATLVPSVVGGLRSGNIRDPFTGRQVSEESDLCEEWASELDTVPASEHRSTQVRGWRSVCRNATGEAATRLHEAE